MAATTTVSAEQPLFLEGPRGRRLFAILHRAHQPAARIPLVYCAPILEEKLNCHRIGVNFARRAAREGFDVLRFDYGGDGESSGDFVDASVEDRVEDVLSAALWLQRTVGGTTVRLVGLRFGAGLALLAAESSSAIGPVALWAPVLQGGPYLYEALRANLTSQLATHKKVVRDRATLIADMRAGGTVDVEGWEIGRTLYDGAEGVDFHVRPIATPLPVLAVRIGKRPLREPPFRPFVEANPAGSIRVESIDELEFWNPQSIAYPPCEALFGLTLEWLRSTAATDAPR